MIYTLPSADQKFKIIFRPHPVIDNYQISGIGGGNVTRVISDLPCRGILPGQITLNSTERPNRKRNKI